MESTKTQIQELLAVSPITAEIITKIKSLLEDPAGKEKQSLADQRAVASLKATVKSLRDQLNPVQAPERPLNVDALLDELFLLQQKRTNEIEAKGESVTFGVSEKVYKALKVNDNAMYFVPGTPVAVGMQVKSDRGGIFIITEVRPCAGRVECKTWHPLHTCQTWTKFPTASGKFNLKQEGTNDPCLVVRDTLTTYGIKYPSDTLLKLSDNFFEVTGVYTDGSLVVHRIKNVDPIAKAQ